MPKVTIEALKAATAIIEAVGGSVKLPYNTVTCWNEVFKDLKTLSNDPRCEVTIGTLRTKLSSGIPLEEAVKISKVQSSMSKSLVCWGETFPSIAALAQDPRCQVGYSVLADKLRMGMPPEDAARNLATRREVRSIEDVLARAHRYRRNKSDADPQV